MSKQADEIAALRAEVDALKAAQPKPEPTAEERERARLKWIDEMHQMREGRASVIPPWLVRDTVGGVTDADARDIFHASHRPQSPGSAIPSSQQLTGVHPGGAPGGGTGWVAPMPLRPPPGVAQADRLMDAQDAKDRAELIEREAKFKAMQKLAEGKP